MLATIVLSATDLRARVARAEAALDGGDWTEAFRQFSALAWSVAADSNWDAFGHNEALVLHRCADIGVMVGRADDALDLYQTLARRATQPEARALAVCKWLDLATQLGAGRLMHEAARALAMDVWSELPPEEWSEVEVTRWERTLAWDEERRVDLLAAMYLGMGRMWNALHRLEESSRWLRRGIHHAADAANGSARSTVIALRLMLARNELSNGRLTGCRAMLNQIASELSTMHGGNAYHLALLGAEAELALIQGRLADLLGHLAAMESLTRAGKMTRALCQCLLSKVDALVTLNLLPEADRCLCEAEAIGSSETGVLRSMANRARFLLASRQEGLMVNWTGRPADDLQNADSDSDGDGDGTGAGDRDRPAMASEPASAVVEEEVIRSGDCLRDYTLRETLLYANIERHPEEAEADLRDLWQDFGDVDSPLLLARLYAASGVLESRRDTPDIEKAAAALERAREGFREIGAEREAYQATLFLARTLRESAPERYTQLLDENDARLLRLAEGLSTEQRNAFLVTRFSGVDERRRVRIQDLLQRRAALRGMPLWRRTRARLDLWRDLHDFLCDVEDEQDSRRKLPVDADACDGADPSTVTDANVNRLAPRRRGFRGLMRRLFTHRWSDQAIGYIVHPDRTFMYESRWGWLDCHEIQLARLGIESLHRAFFTPSRQEFDTQAAASCKALGLQGVLDARPARIRSLTIVPDAGLHVLPFCALRYRKPDGAHVYLVEIDRVAIAFDTVAMSHARRSRANGRNANAVVAFYDGVENRLEIARETAQTAAKWLGARGWTVDEPIADKSECLDGLRHGAAFYYFGHGHFHRGRPGVSGLDFGGADGAPNERLTLRDLDEVDFFNVEQAVVLACHGADAAAYEGGWVVSVPRMLMRRGARSVLGALWQVEMTIAAEVSARFFDLAVRHGRAEALRIIQRDLVRKKHRPYWWAAFQIYGDSGSLTTPNRKRSWLNDRVRSRS